MNAASSRMMTTAWLAVMSVGLAAIGAQGGLREASSASVQSKAAEDPAPLANGVYSVLREGPTRTEARPGGVAHVTLVYDQKYSNADRNRPPSYVALDTSSFVPLILAGPPETAKDDNGRTLLRLTLAQEHVKTLEDFTRAHLDGSVAIVIGGEIITMHKVRSVIEGGRVQITRCTDEACQVLRLKLTK